MITGIHKDIEVMKTEMREKSVALVGPALYMAGIGLGNEIDSHDIVIRLNRGMESVSKYSEDVGTRTDILYSCLIEKKANAGIIDIDYNALHFHFYSNDDKPFEKKKLNIHIWYDENSMLWLKSSYEKLGNWEYRLKKAEF